jgi:hypothetical protein
MKLYRNLDLVKVNEVLNARIHNVDNTTVATLAGTLNTGHKGLIVYNTEEEGLYFWDGAAFVAASSTIAGAMTFKGGIAHNATEPATPSTGDLWVFNSAGTNTWNSGSREVEIGDSAVWNGSDWNIIQANVVTATESVKGVVELATTTEATTGTDTERAVTPAGLAARESGRKLARSYFASGVSVSANTPFTVEHNLALQNRNAFTINIMDSNHSAVMMDVDSVDQNNLTITSSIALTGLHVFVVGF